MRSLDARIEELERLRPVAERVTIVLRKLVAPGEQEQPITRLRDSRTSQTWERKPGEGEDTFVERVSSELLKLRGPLACSMLIDDGSASPAS